MRTKEGSAYEGRECVRRKGVRTKKGSAYLAVGESNPVNATDTRSSVAALPPTPEPASAVQFAVTVTSEGCEIGFAFDVSRRGEPGSSATDGTTALCTVTDTASPVSLCVPAAEVPIERWRRGERSCAWADCGRGRGGDGLKGELFLGFEISTSTVSGASRGTRGVPFATPLQLE